MMSADDCVLYINAKSWLNIHDRLQRSLDKYISWGNEHNLKLNAS